MEIRVADMADKTEIIAMYQRSQLATGLPDPALIPPSELGSRLYERHAMERYVAIVAGHIVGHALIEKSNPSHDDLWRRALLGSSRPLVEMGGAFVEPSFSGRGIWNELLSHRLKVIREAHAHPVTATWSVNEHVKRTFYRHGGIEAGWQSTPLGDVDLFVF